MTIKICLFLVLLGLATANLHLNIKFRDVVDGKVPLNQRIAQ